jgi:hypothetical protein
MKSSFFLLLTVVPFLSGCFTYLGHQVYPPYSFSSPHTFQMEKIYTNKKYNNFILTGKCTKHRNQAILIFIDHNTLKTDWRYRITENEKWNFHPLFVLKRHYAAQDEILRSLDKYLKPVTPSTWIILHTPDVIDGENYFDVTAEYGVLQEKIPFNSEIPTSSVFGHILYGGGVLLDVCTSPVQVPVFLAYLHIYQKQEKDSSFPINRPKEEKRVNFPDSWSKKDIQSALLR